ERRETAGRKIRVDTLVEARAHADHEVNEVFALDLDVAVCERAAGSQQPDEHAVVQGEDADERLVTLEQPLRGGRIDGLRRCELTVTGESQTQLLSGSRQI